MLSDLMYALFFPQKGKENRKLGVMPVAYTSNKTCPPECPLKDGRGCYAESGPVRLAWDRVTAGLSGIRWLAFLQDVRTKIGPGQPWRFGVAGDLPGEGSEIHRTSMTELISANLRRLVIAYTHKPVLDRQGPHAESNRQAIAEAMEGGFHVNLSGNNLRHADELAALNLASVVTVLPKAYERRSARGGRGNVVWAETIAEYRDRIADLPTHTPAGRRIAVCPATYSDTTCSACLACTKPRAGGAIIGLPAHGSRGRKADTIAHGHLAARDVPVGERWTFPNHRTMAEVMADEQAAA